MTQPPAPGAEKNVFYPEIPEKRLSNGLRVLVVRDDRFPRLSVKLVLSVGRVCNPDDNLALVSLTVELLKSGTRTRSARDISNLIDQWAIQYASEVLMEHGCISMTLLEHHLEPALELLSDIVRNPSFIEHELKKLKVRWKSHLIAQRSQPNFLATERAFKTIYPAHPYSKVSMTPEDLERATAESVLNTYRRHCVPGNAYLLFAGPIDLDQATGLAERFLGSWESQEAPSIDYPQPAPIARRLVCLVHRPHSVQSQILLGCRTLPKVHPDAIALKVANQVLGGGASARLFLNLREQKGYTYGVYSRLKSYRHDGLFLAEASVKTEVTLESIEEMLKELEHMRKQLPEEEELSRSQSELIGSFIRQMESPASVGALEVNRRLYQLPEGFYRNFIPTVRGVKREMVREMARRFFDPERVVLTVVADRARVENELQNLGELRLYDVHGNRI
ncbi:MAG: M16 family metallopeptidase [Acidobacteriota bacterium]